MREFKVPKFLLSFFYVVLVAALVALPKVSFAAVETQTSKQRCDNFKANFLGAFDWVKNDYCTASGVALLVSRTLLALSGTAAVIFIMIGGFLYLTSGGNEEQAESGKKTLTNALLGLIVVMMATAFVTIISNLLTSGK